MCAESIWQISLVSSAELFCLPLSLSPKWPHYILQKRMLMVRCGFGIWYIKESSPYYSKSVFLPDLSGKRSYLKALVSSSPVVTNSPPHPQRTIEEISCTINLPADFSPTSKISPSLYLLQKGMKRVCFEFDLCFGFCSRPLETNKMTHTTVPRAKCLQKCGLPENPQLYQVWDFSYIPWCFSIVWFHHLSPTLPNFYQTRQEAGTLYSVCTVALSKTSLFSFFANVSGKGINMLCAKWITAN